MYNRVSSYLLRPPGTPYIRNQEGGLTRNGAGCLFSIYAFIGSSDTVT